MISLLNHIKRLPQPPLEQITSKLVEFGQTTELKKVLILDMDETMLHAKFIANDCEEHDGDFEFFL